MFVRVQPDLIWLDPVLAARIDEDRSRQRLVEGLVSIAGDLGARLIATEGADGLTLRRVADEVGTSTMAVYTHFGGMTELRREVRREGFARLGAALTAVELTGDAVADLVLLGWAYYSNGTTNPNLYRAMFMDGPVGEADAEVGRETFDQLVTGVRRARG